MDNKTPPAPASVYTDTYRTLQQQRLEAARAALAPLAETHRELTLEIGCGHGHFLTAYAKAHPSEFCVGLDLLRDRIERARRKSERAGLTNIAWLHTEATLALSALPDAARLRRILILFPDPWPKRRHWKNRIVQLPFLNELAEHTTPGTALCFRTDHAPYHDWTLAHLEAHPCWRVAPTAPWPFEEITVFQSRAPAYQSLVALRTEAPVPALAEIPQPTLPE